MKNEIKIIFNYRQSLDSRCSETDLPADPIRYSGRRVTIYVYITRSVSVWKIESDFVCIACDRCESHLEIVAVRVTRQHWCCSSINWASAVCERTRTEIKWNHNNDNFLKKKKKLFAYTNLFIIRTLLLLSRFIVGETGYRKCKQRANSTTATNKQTIRLYILSLFSIAKSTIKLLLLTIVRRGKKNVIHSLATI